MVQGFFCCRLNTGGMIIGWLGAVSSLFAVIVLSIALGNLDAIVEEIKKNSETDPATIRAGLQLALGFYLTLCAINLVTSVLLIVGTVKERHLLLLPWLFNSGVALFLNFLAYFGIIARLFGSIGSNAFVPGFLSFLIVSSVLALYCYVWCAIYSLYKQIQAGRAQQQHLLNHTSGPPSYNKI